MSVGPLTWAMDDAPMLLTEKGKPDTTARHVLQVLAEHAHPDGSNSHPSVVRIQYRTGYDRTTVQRALRRLERGGLIRRDGVVNGRTRWRLAMELTRPESDWAALESDEEAHRAAAAERKRRSRAKAVTHSESVTSQALSPSVTGVTPSRHALRSALTTNEPPEEPPIEPPENPQTPPAGGVLIELPTAERRKSGAVAESPEFVEFYERVWSRREARLQAHKAWVSAVKTTDPAVILAGARRAVDQYRRERRERKHIPLPATWLNGKRWTDEFPTTDGPSQQRAVGVRFNDYSDQSRYDGWLKR